MSVHMFSSHFVRSMCLDIMICKFCCIRIEQDLKDTSKICNFSLLDQLKTQRGKIKSIPSQLSWLHGGKWEQGQ